MLSRKTSLKLQGGKGIGGEVGGGVGDWGVGRCRGDVEGIPKYFQNFLIFSVSFIEISRKFPMI